MIGGGKFRNPKGSYERSYTYYEIPKSITTNLSKKIPY